MPSLEAFETDRIDALTDGIFAVIMTLLVLELKAPSFTGKSDTNSFFAVFAEVMPEIELWLVSFVILSVLWLAHHFYLMGLKLTGAGIGLMLGFLGCVSLTPFAVELVVAADRHHGAMILFSGILGTAGLLLIGAYLNGARHMQKVENTVVLRLSMLPLGAAIAGGLATVHHRTSLWIWVVVSMLSLLPIRR